MTTTQIKLIFNTFLLFIVATKSHAQQFKRIEFSSGLGILQDNNSVSTADIDLDNDLDLFVVSKHKDKNGINKTNSRLFRNENNGKFVDITASSGLTELYPYDGIDDSELSKVGLEGYKFGSFWGDYNNDGFPDLLLTHNKKVQLFKNQKDGTFTEVTNAAGITKNNGCNNTGATWFDYNNDGFLDLFINDWKGCNQNTFYENNGDGTFKNITQKTNSLPTDQHPSYTMFPFDFNKDNLLDLYISNDLKKENGLYINKKTKFTEEASNYGLNNTMDDMAIVMNDFNLDGHFDFFITGINENILLKNNGFQQFSDVTNNNRITIPEEVEWPGYWSWGCTFDDFDLDGDEDIVIANGSSFGKPLKNMYFQNQHQQGFSFFTELSQTIGFEETSISSEVLSFDYDNDGDLDLLITNSFSKPYFFQNQTINSEDTSYTWVKIHLQGTTSNKNAYGTEITLKTKDNLYKRYYNGVSFISQSIKPVHFGLGGDKKILEIQIKWPSGIIETYQDLDSNQEYKFIEAQGYQSLAINSSKKIKGCTDPNSCTYNPLATDDDGSCTYLSNSTIQGATNSTFLKEETYTYPALENVKFNWNVQGGTIIKGHGTHQITVKWELEKTGKVAVVTTNNNCTSKETILDVSLSANTQEKNSSIARLWNEALLTAIRNDYARPTVHARNLFHSSIAMYDAWAIFSPTATPYLIGNTVHHFSSNFDGFDISTQNDENRKKAISFALYRLLTHRFKNSPGAAVSLEKFDLLMQEFNYNTENTCVDYQNGDAACLGNYIAQQIIQFGFTDGSNEENDYRNKKYFPTNKELVLSDRADNLKINDPNRWQPLAFTKFIDQSGNVSKSTPDFLSPEWGNVIPFSLTEADKSTLVRNGTTYYAYHLPDTPPQLDTLQNTTNSRMYKWNFSLVSLWSSHLDPDDGVLIDISPASIGNISIDEMPLSYQDYPLFYKDEKGGDISKGHSINPYTQQPYQQQIVPKADYARVLAEFWADGPDSETPPGHWFTILNHVSDHALLEKKWNGTGNVLSDLEWDIKSYFVLAGAMHDAAISAWSIKGWMDYVRPISAIRYMAKLGQSSNPELDRYHPGGIPLKEGFIELVKEGDPLSGFDNRNVGKIKVKAWRGHDYIQNPKEDIAGVGWILAKNWWPYQRPSFVTPPFAGFVSGHSTFSRAAAEVLTLITGDPFFPGGIGEFVAKKDEFLVFEKGPSVDVTLQWATYRDASDQTSLSRIWGGIHPPADDIPGRLIGEKVGKAGYQYALPYFDGSHQETKNTNDFIISPNPVNTNQIQILNSEQTDTFTLFSIQGQAHPTKKIEYNSTNKSTVLSLPENMSSGIYYLKINGRSKPLIVIK
ncbi:FG-GAP-like repeat-containing protein [Ochrovirga pacifica]|uniref:FG-GAP-like repeat-containing protein n=1 Tax=Ochrovirga pacifica TaxID=1042376 RepID=UPI0002558756|nr:FG-GAP-like repeat-containing protein [Ochrovirga pacifica]